MRTWRFGSRRAASLRVLGLALTSVLLLSACGSKQEIVYVDHKEEHQAASHGASTPLARGTSPLVHKNGNHQPAEPVQIGPRDADGQADSYTPIAAQGSPLVRSSDAGHQHGASAVFAHERAAGAGSHAAYSAPTPATVARTGAASAKPGAAAKPAASPTVPDRLSLGTGLGASASATSRGLGNTLTLTDDADDTLATVSGRIESIVGPTLNVKTAAGTTRVQLAEHSRVDRDALGTQDDLKPGRFVGVLQVPGGPAASIRLYATGPSMPRPGIVPVVGSRTGQVTSFGSVVTLQFGGVLLNTGGATTTVTLPSGVEILKPAPADPSALTVGTQIIATGVMSGDDVLTASAVRITGEARVAR